MRGIALLLLGCAGVWAQAPKINAVITTGPHDQWFGPGSLVYIYGTFTPQSAGRDYTITVGGQSGGINVADNGVFITAAIPANAPAGNQTLTVTYQGQVSNGLPVTIAPLAPEFEGGGVTILGSSSPPQFTPYSPFTHGVNNSSVTPISPAAPQEVLEATVYGIGEELPPPVQPTVTVAGQNATVLQTQGSNGRISMAFVVPGTVPAGMQPVIATVAGTSTKPVLLPVGTAPAVASVVNSASFGSADSVAPGSIVSVFGANFGSKDNLAAFPATDVNGTSVLFNGTAAPVFALAGTAGQINVLVPDELTPGGTVAMTVTDAAGTSTGRTLNVVAAVPGIFTYSDPLVLTRRNAVAVTANTAWIAMPGSMAASLGIPSNCAALGAAQLCAKAVRAGDVLTIYATGLGKATANGDPNGAVLATGSVAPADGKPVYQTVATPAVTIGGAPATVLFSGLVPGLAGLYQVNVVVPSVAAGDDVPVQVSIGGASDQATIAVAQ
jgi:uncharacterized protein (TIGR03437 family)